MHSLSWKMTANILRLGWCLTVSHLPTIPEKRLSDVHKLIRSKCCNYDHGCCIGLDDGESCCCVQMISNSLVCKWFRNAVLPYDALLEATILDRHTKKCAVCGKAFAPKSNKAKYCRPCAVQKRRDTKREWARRRNFLRLDQ